MNLSHLITPGRHDHRLHGRKPVTALPVAKLNGQQIILARKNSPYLQTMTASSDRPPDSESLDHNNEKGKASRTSLQPPSQLSPDFYLRQFTAVAVANLEGHPVIVTSSKDKTVQVWDGRHRHCLDELVLPDPARCLALGAAGTLVVGFGIDIAVYNSTGTMSVENDLVLPRRRARWWQRKTR